MIRAIHPNPFNDNDVLLPIGYALGYSSNNIFTIQTSHNYIELSNEHLIVIWTRIKNGTFIYSELYDLVSNELDISQFNQLLNDLIANGLLIHCINDNTSIYNALTDIIPVSQGYGLGYTNKESSLFTILQNNKHINIESESSLLWTLANGYYSYSDINNILISTIAEESTVNFKYSITDILGLSTLIYLSNNLMYLL